MSRFLFRHVLGLLLVAPLPAYAGSTHTSLIVGVEVENYCGANLPAADAAGGRASSVDLAVSCSKGTAYAVTVDKEPAAAIEPQVSVQAASSGLFQDASLKTTWADSSTGQVADGVSAGHVKVYGRGLSGSSDDQVVRVTVSY